MLYIILFGLALFLVIINIHNIINLLKKNDYANNIIISLVYLGIKVYTYFQIKYKKFYDKYLKNLITTAVKNKCTVIQIGKEPQNFYFHDKESNLIEKSFLDKELIEKNNNEIFIKKDCIIIIETQKDEKIYRIINKLNYGDIPPKFKSSILSAEIILVNIQNKQEDNKVEKKIIDITDFIHTFFIINDIKIELFKKYYEIIFSKDFSEFYIEKIVLLDSDCNEKIFTDKISYNF